MMLYVRLGIVFSTSMHYTTYLLFEVFLFLIYLRHSQKYKKTYKHTVAQTGAHHFRNQEQRMVVSRSVVGRKRFAYGVCGRGCVCVVN